MAEIFYARQKFALNDGLWLYAAEQNGELLLISTLAEEVPGEAQPRRTPVLQECFRQLEEYFAGTRHSFELPLASARSDFSARVRQAMQAIPYGETASYGQLAQQVGSPRGARAVGQACHRNPLLIVVPCHRVVGSSGALTGFAVGLELKQALLQLEQDNLPQTEL